MADIIQVNEAFRCQLLAREAESAAALLLAYGTVWTALADRRDAVLAVIERAQARGETVAPSLVIASRETRQLLLQVVGEIDSLAPALTDHVTTEQAPPWPSRSKRCRI
jgi:sugar/nucleoside kinase (ribokinase family)